VAEGLAGLAALAAEPERAARLYGAADALRTEIGAPRPPTERVAEARQIEAVRASLGGAAFDAAWSAGRALAPEQAVREALGQADFIAPRSP
jgi:hypothetical protein